MPGADQGAFSPLISVVIPVKDGAATLASCLQSIRDAAGEADLDSSVLEILVVDNGSSDDSAAVALEAGCTLLEVPAEQGVSAARNRGARAAGGKFLVFTDSDVLFRRKALRAVLEAFEDQALDGIVGVQDPDARYPDRLSQYKNLWMAYSYSRLSGAVPLFYTSAAAIRRELFLELEGFDEQYRRPSVEDTEFGQRLSCAGKRIEVCPDFLVEHRKYYRLETLFLTDFRRTTELCRLLLRRRFSGGSSEANRANSTSVPSSAMAAVLLGMLSLISSAAALGAGRPLIAICSAAGLLLYLALHAGFLCFIGRHAGFFSVMLGMVILLLDLGWITGGLIWGLFSFAVLGIKY